jgi:hypothetical protein
MTINNELSILNSDPFILRLNDIREAMNYERVYLISIINDESKYNIKRLILARLNLLKTERDLMIAKISNENKQILKKLFLLRDIATEKFLLFEKNIETLVNDSDSENITFPKKFEYLTHYDLYDLNYS